MTTSNPDAGTPALSPGNFCWIELGTTDQNAAKAFYGALFGWQFSDSLMGPGQVYTMFTLGGKFVAAGYTMQKEQVERGVPPHWLIYVATPSTDASVTKATELGGAALMPAFDVFDAGRMAVLRDPTGAVFAVWQANRHAGLGVANVPGALCWADLSTPEADKASAFYRGMFGWEIEGPSAKDSGYRHIKNGETPIGGIPPAAHRNPHAPPHWLAYFQVADCNATAEKAKSLGAKLHFGPTFMENVGTISVIADPQGAIFAIFQPAPRK